MAGGKSKGKAKVDKEQAKKTGKVLKIVAIVAAVLVIALIAYGLIAGHPFRI